MYCYGIINIIYALKTCKRNGSNAMFNINIM